MRHWLTELNELLGAGREVVRVVVSAVHGSAPREAGACLLVHRDSVLGTIGGGTLEFQAVRLARELLEREPSPPLIQRFSLGASLGQCCGGIVELWWERFDPSERPFVARAARHLASGEPVLLAAAAAGRALLSSDGAYLETQGLAVPAELIAPERAALSAEAPVRCLGQGAQAVLLERLARDHTPLWLFGAGHVGRALVAVLRDLPFDIHWVDSRADAFPSGVPDNVTPRHAEDPAAVAAEAPAGAWYLVLTHSHEQDFEICRAVLARDDIGFLGLIGSRPKSVRFAQRLHRAGIPVERIDAMTCPIGIAGIRSKLPAAIAVSVAAQLLQLREQGAVGAVRTRRVVS